MKIIRRKIFMVVGLLVVYFAALTLSFFIIKLNAVSGMMTYFIFGFMHFVHLHFIHKYKAKHGSEESVQRIDDFNNNKKIVIRAFILYLIAWPSMIRGSWIVLNELFRERKIMKGCGL